MSVRRKDPDDAGSQYRDDRNLLNDRSMDDIADEAKKPRIYRNDPSFLHKDIAVTGGPSKEAEDWNKIRGWM